MEVELSSTAFEIESLRISDEQPVIYCYDLVPGKVINNNLELLNLRKKCDSMMQFFDNYTSYKVKQYASTVNAVLASNRISGLLNSRPSLPMIYLEGIMYDEKGEAIDFGYQYFRSDKYHFKLVRKR